MPLLHILAGPNGSGKTTFYETAMLKGFVGKDLPFLNVDLITKDLGGYTDENYAQADHIYRDKVKQYISSGSSFMIESNLARLSDYDWIEKMIRAGYEVILYFVSTSNVEENVNRVKRRVKEGGHDIPDHIVRDRYHLGLVYLKPRLAMFREVFILDNTSYTVKEMAHIVDGRIESEAADCPDWVNSALFFLKRAI